MNESEDLNNIQINNNNSRPKNTEQILNDIDKEHTNIENKNITIKDNNINDNVNNKFNKRNDKYSDEFKCNCRSK